MFSQKNFNDLNNLPPLVQKEAKKIMAGPDKPFSFFIGFLIIAAFLFSSLLKKYIPFGEFLWVFLFFIALLSIIKTSGKINRALRAKNTDIGKEYNKQGDALLFYYATRSGELRLFDPLKTIKFIVAIPFCTFCLMLGFLFLHLALYKTSQELFFFGLLALVVSLGVSFLFLFEDKRILNEARRRDQFIDMAEKRWSFSKKIYIFMIILALTSAILLIQNNLNFVEKGVFISNGQIIFDGR